jgi:O-antigen ligase
MSIAVFVGMCLSLGVFYRAGALSATLITQLSLSGLAVFAVLALLRPALALLFVPLTAPLYLIPIVLPNLRATLVALQIHEMALLICAAATVAQIGWNWLVRRQPWPFRLDLALTAREYAPHGLLLLAAGLGVLLAVERAPAIREVARLLVTPLIFYALLRYHLCRVPDDQRQALNPQLLLTLLALIAIGALVALVGMLQLVGIDLTQRLFGWKTVGGFTPAVIPDGNTLRATSVYGHPNNLALALGRIWPLAAGLACGLVLGATQSGGVRLPAAVRLGLFGILVVAVVLCLGGIQASVSRGALLGINAAIVVLATGVLLLEMRRQRDNPQRARQVRALMIVGVVLVVGFLAWRTFSLREGVASGSVNTRLLLWEEALTLIQRQPFGLGPDQFYYYHNPEFGRSIIDPRLIGTSEEFAAHPHNLLLDLWLRLGPIGVIAFAWLILRFFWRGFWLVQRAALAPAYLVLGACAAMAAALTHGMVDNFYFVPDLAFTFWLLLAGVDFYHEQSQQSDSPRRTGALRSP